jgi:hypothetical protein
MDEKTYKSLLNILDYLKDEKRDWEENGKPENHIYNDIQRLSNWADEVAKDY